MKANELMVGDLVQLDFGNNDTEKRYVVPEDISNKCFLKCAYPIPTTLGLIEELGFKTVKDVTGFSMELELDGYFIEINTLSNSKDREYNVHIDNQDRESIGNCDVQYLHQLQQFVRLATGKELNIEL